MLPALFRSPSKVDKLAQRSWKHRLRFNRLDDFPSRVFKIVDVVGEGDGEAQAGGAGRHCWRADGGYGFPEMLQQK